MYNSRSQGVANISQVGKMGQKSIDQGMTRVSRRWMNRQPGWLVYNQKVIILINDI
jgi:hypothetical protein